MHQERCACRVAWNLAKQIHMLRNADNASFHTPVEARVVPAPTSKRPDEREFVVDSGATMCMLSKKNSSSGEMDTVKRSRTPTVVLTANGEVQAHEEAQVFVHDLNLFVTVHLLDETPADLSLGKLCEDHGYSHEWSSGQKPRLTKEGKTTVCKTDNFVPLVVLQGFHKFWEQFVVNIGITGLVEKRGGATCFKFSIRAK